MCFNVIKTALIEQTEMVAVGFLLVNGPKWHFMKFIWSLFQHSGEGYKNNIWRWLRSKIAANSISRRNVLL